MENKFVKFSPFQVDPEPIMEEFKLTDADFEKAEDSEKESMVETRKSVSFWQDAARRFKANKVSMVALVVFILVLIFAFLGPVFIPYNYSDQYRSSQKLGPMEYSQTEQLANTAGKVGEGMYATSIQPGAMTALRKGDYYIQSGGKTYAFTLTKGLEDVVLILDTKSDPALYYIDDGEYDLKKLSKKEGRDVTVDEIFDTYTKTAIEYTDTAAEGATQVKLSKSVFPHVFGTDSVGRDLMARTMFGARVSIIIGIMAAIIVLIIGAAYGSISGLAGGKVDFVMMRIVELIYSIPEVLIVLLLQVVLKDPLQTWFDTSSNPVVSAMSDLGTGIVSIMITFALLYWVTMARIIRGQVLQLKKQEYVTAAVALGASNRRIIKKHLLPNCVGALVITTCLQIPSAIFLESFLSFLGMGVSAPMASLGSLCSDALETISLYPYRLLFPAIILTIIVLSLNLIGDGLRDALDPRLKK